VRAGRIAAANVRFVDGQREDDPGSFYLPVGPDQFESTRATTSPWDPNQQHGGPPSALLARAIERAGADPELVVARFSVDFFGGVPQGRVRTTATVLRPGRRIELIEATLSAGDRTVAVARAWRIKPSPDVETPPLSVPQVAIPGPQPQTYFETTDPGWGYGRAIESRFVRSSYSDLGPALVWMRVLVPLVAGEESTGLQRMLIIGDSINGLSAELELREWLFVPPGLTFTAHRVDAGEWMLLDATSTIDPSGIGMANGTISDGRGELGLVTQPLLLQRR
jgi:hypothetical protein